MLRLAFKPKFLLCKAPLRCFSSNEPTDPYYPYKLPEFKNENFPIFQCSDTILKKKRLADYPFPVASFCTGTILYKCFYWSGWLGVTLPAVPLLMAIVV